MNNILTKSGKLSVIFACVLLLVVSASAQLSLRKALDIDADGKADFAVFRPSNNVWYINKSGGGGFVSQQFGSSNTDYQTPGDYDGDGKGDISVWRDTDGGWYRLNSSNNTFTGVAFGVTGDEPIARDYDGGTMTWFVLKSTNGALQVAQFGLSTDYTAPGDYDGDLKFDFAVQRPGANPTDQGTFYILQSTNGGLSTIPWGASNDLVVPGDYDGDGKTDVAVVREGTTANTPLNWYIRRSSNGSLQAVAFGTTGTDLITQNDYDGDGKTDVAIWRDTTGFFYYLRSIDGALVGFQWGATNDFPVASYDTH
jgi:hypothetical protein